MVVTYGGFNDAVVRGELDLEYPSIMKKPNTIDKAKFLKIRKNWTCRIQ